MRTLLWVIFYKNVNTDFCTKLSKIYKKIMTIFRCDD